MLLFFLLSPMQQVFSDTNDETEVDYPENSPDISPKYTYAFLETFGSNVFLSFINRYVRKADYAMTDRDSVRNNLRSRWVWDQDEFSVNHLGHPYQGSYYYIAGRSNGMGFWQSAVLTLMGSQFWEIYMETELPSKNDIIVTTMGGTALGEMLHRLYVEADRSDSSLKWLISPLDSINGLMHGRRANQGNTYQRIEPEESSFFTGTGVLKGALDELRGDESSILTPDIFAGGTVVYGYPYGIRVKTPFEQFEQRIELHYSLPQYYSIKYFSDGFLWAIPVLDTPNTSGTLGIGLHYDFLFESFVNMFSNAIGLSYKMDRIFQNNVHWSLKLHANYVFLGGSEFIPVWYGDVVYRNPDEEHRLYDIGIGENAKLYTYISHPQWGTVLCSAAFYGFHTLPAAVPEKGSSGYSTICIFDLAYEHRLLKTWSLGIGANIYYKRGFYDTASDVEESITSYRIYFKKRFNH
jgi:hypothetical protein